MCSVPKPHQPPQGVYFDTLIVMYQNENYKYALRWLSISWYINTERKCQYWCEINLYWLATSAVHQFYNSLVLSSLHQKFIISLSVHQFIRSSVHQFTSWSLHHQFINSSFQQFRSSAVQQQFIRSSPISSLIHQLIIS